MKIVVVQDPVYEYALFMLEKYTREGGISPDELQPAAMLWSALKSAVSVGDESLIGTPSFDPDGKLKIPINADISVDYNPGGTDE